MLFNSLGYLVLLACAFVAHHYASQRHRWAVLLTASVAFYAAQVEAEGQITRWMPAAPPKPKTRYRTRFAFGDALGTHMAACRA